MALVLELLLSPGGGQLDRTDCAASLGKIEVGNWERGVGVAVRVVSLCLALCPSHLLQDSLRLCRAVWFKSQFGCALFRNVGRMNGVATRKFEVSPVVKCCS